MECRAGEAPSAEGESYAHTPIFDNGPVHIRRATAEDALSVTAIIEEVYVGGGWADPVTSPDYVRSLLDAMNRIAQATVLVAEVDGRLVGTVTATDGPPLANIVRPGELEVRMLGVLPAARRSGVARELMRACEQLARESGAVRVVLSTDLGMTAAQSLYEGLGYVRTPDRDWSIHGARLITYGRRVCRNARTWQMRRSGARFLRRKAGIPGHEAAKHLAKMADS